MMKWLEMINVFGIPFTFTVFHQKKYKTLLGLFFSLLSLVLVLVFAFLFGNDFFFRQNPKAISSKIIPTDYIYLNMTSDMLVLPWRISNSALEKVNFSSLIYPVIYYHRYLKSPETNEVLDHQVTRLPYAACKPNPTFTTIEIENYYCFDLEGIVLGGNWEGAEYSYITFYLTFCPDGNSFNSDDNCLKKDIDELYSILNGDNPWIFVLVYPEHNFQPKSIEVPIHKNYKIYTYVLNLELMREDSYTFQKVKMVDDQGLIFPEKNETSMISLYEKDSVFYFFNYASLFEGNSSSVFYILNLSLGKNYEEYFRSYMKFQEVIANIGGFVRVVVILFDVCCCSISEIFMTASLISHFFIIENPKGHRNSNPCLNISRFGPNVSSGNALHLAGNVDKTMIQLNNSKLSLDPNTNITKYGNSKIDLEFVKIIKAKRANLKNPALSLCNLMRYHWFQCCINNRSDKEKTDGYSIALKAINSRIEVLNHIQMMNEIEVLKNLLLNKFQNISLNYMRKINVFNTEALGQLYQDIRSTEEERKNLKCLSAYYTETKMLKLPFDKDYDMKLYQYLDPNIQKIL